MKGKAPPESAFKECNSFTKRRKIGRPRSTFKVGTIQYAIDFLEKNDDETITLQDLHQVMLRESGMTKEVVYTRKANEAIALWNKGVNYQHQTAP